MTATFKKSISDLALFGGSPLFREPLHVGRPNFGDRAAFLDRIDGILSSKRFTNDGPLVRELEGEISRLVSVEHCIATANATIALQMLTRALELKDSVVMPSFTFAATAHAFQWVGVKPVFSDIEPATHGVDPASLEAKMGPKCSAIVGVHTWGIPCDVDALDTLARRRGVPLILDAAQALGCWRQGIPIGGGGVAEVFSLHATKVINSFEGGVITTRDAGLAARLRLLRDFGFAGYDHVVAVGTNAKLSELHAAAGLTTLAALSRIVEENRRCFEDYRRVLGGISGLRLLDVAAKGRSNHQYIVVELDPAARGVSRDTLVRALHAEGVNARRYFYPGCHRMLPYASPDGQPELPVTEDVAEHVVVLPTGQSVGTGDIEAIGILMELIVHRSEDFSARASKLPQEADRN